jgi:hypothetical protein
MHTVSVAVAPETPNVVYFAFASACTAAARTASDAPNATDALRAAYLRRCTTFKHIVIAPSVPLSPAMQARITAIHIDIALCKPTFPDNSGSERIRAFF